MSGPLRFELAELIREVDLMRGLAAGFLEPDAVGVLFNLREQLETLKYRNCDHTMLIGVDPQRPIGTIACNGGYERNEGGTHKNLFGELLFKWELRPLGAASKKRAAKRQVEVAGTASTVARLRIEHDGHIVDLASWRMEFGACDSPGAFFHSQIPDTLGASDQQDGPEHPFRMWPTWLPVPRLPIPALTPMLALEFVLAEIFQDRWPEHLASGVYEANQWRTLQQRRFVRYFEWQKANAEKSGKGSPLLATKVAKPASDMFLE